MFDPKNTIYTVKHGGGSMVTGNGRKHEWMVEIGYIYVVNLICG